MAASEFLKDYGPAIAWFVSAIGWGVANWQANERESRKEIRDEVQEACELVGKLIKDLTAYRQTEPSSIEALTLEHLVKFSLQDLSLRLHRLSSLKAGAGPRLDLSNAIKILNDIYDLATGGDFESADRDPKARDNGQLRLCTVRALMFSDELRGAFQRAFT